MGMVARQSISSLNGEDQDSSYTADSVWEDINLNLILDDRSGDARFPAFQSYFCEYSLLLISESSDMQIYLLDAGNFALETRANGALDAGGDRLPLRDSDSGLRAVESNRPVGRCGPSAAGSSR